MFMNSYIHLLEAVTILLVGVLAFQIYRCYKNFYLTQKSLSEYSNILQPAINAGVCDVPVLMPLGNFEANEEKQKVRSSKSVPNVSPTEINRAEEILNDYIGEFFTETHAVDISAFKVDQHEETIVMDTLPVSSFDHALNDSEGANEDVIEVIPVLNTPILPESFAEASNSPISVDDDLVITVANTSASNMDDGSDNIMSDKVVHAMLDEAKLVCVS